VAGFEPVQLLTGLVHLLRQFKSGRAQLENVYPAVVSEKGNGTALALIEHVFAPADAPWRELGIIPESGLELKPPFMRFDALRRFGVVLGDDRDHPSCKCGEVIQGKVEPADCPLFGHGCTPLTPIGPCMVSSEGTCAAWFKYGGTKTTRTGVPSADTKGVSPCPA
jgi:hydrogenase expression/formation protein HypD